MPGHCPSPEPSHSFYQPVREWRWLRATVPLQEPQPPTGPSAAGSGAPSWSMEEDKPLSSEQLESTYRRGVNAGLRAQAGGPLGLSWGCPGLNLFWKQEGKTGKLLWTDVKGYQPNT